MKDQYKETDTVRNIEEIQFGMLSPQDMEQLSHAHIINYEGYRTVKGIPEPVPYGVVDPRMGVSQKDKICGTCCKSLLDCVGHFGYIDLPRPLFHVGYIKNIINILQNICKNCAKVLLGPEAKEAHWKNFKHTSSYLQKKAFYKATNEKCKKIHVCPYCGSHNGVVKKAPFVQIIHEKFNKTLKKNTPVMSDYFSLYEFAVDHNKEVTNYLNSNFIEILTASYVLSLFSRIPDVDLPLLSMDHKYGHPKHLILTRLLVPPNCIRPSVISNIGSKAGTTEDGITVTLTEILHCIENISRKQTGSIWDLETQYFILQLLAALLINSDLQFPLEFKRDKDRSIRGFVQRLKGKQGRFRGNLSGKRVDFSSRTVISPDPNLRINEVGVPVEVAMVLTYPEMVFPHNIELMRQLVKNGPDVYPGAICVESRSNSKFKKSLRYVRRDKAAAELKMGDIVERHLMDGDVVLFNRQPSLHKMSIMSHQARVMPWRTFRFNECVCAPYNADFDGDEMNLHLPQTEEARAEAWNLMGSIQFVTFSSLAEARANSPAPVTPRHGALIIGATQDFLTGSYLMTQKDQFFDKESACGLISSILASKETEYKLDLPEPAIIKPIQLWTGKQIFSLIMRPNKGTIVKDKKVLCNLITKRKDYTKGEELCTNEAWIIIRNSELLAGSLDKSLLGSGTKKNIFYVMLKDFGKDYAADCMWRVARVSSYYLMHVGFSIGIGDVMPGCGLLNRKQVLLDGGYTKCSHYIEQLRDGALTCQPGCTPEETLEQVILKELSNIRDNAGKACVMELHRSNSALIMAICGSKGSFINISQMIACVGQQAIGGKRVPNGFEDRSLPHFPRYSKIPAAKGFVSNSFFSGITPTEFIFHTMAGREGLVDTAVKTAETGYMQRRLVKTLEDLYVAYDKTIRDSNQDVVQFCFGGDGLDPTEMEGINGPIDLERLLIHITSKNLYLKEKPLSGSEIVTMATEYFKEDVFADLSDEFKAEVVSFLKKAALKVDKIRPIYEALPKPKKHTKKKITATDFVERITLSHITDFLNTCSDRYHAALIEPGTAVGALCAQSIGEPGTQMTLKTFHFAGVAAMNITLGVPRILEIMNVSKSISTPIITAKLVCDTNAETARQIKGRIEKTTLGEICEYLEEVFLPDDFFLLIKLAFHRIKLLKLEVDAASVKYAICTSKIRELKVREQEVSLESETIIIVRPNRSEKKTSMYYQLQHIKQHITDVVIKGLPSVSRAVINQNDSEGVPRYELLVEGNNLREVMATYGVDGRRCTSNNTVEVFACLGIAAARDTIIKEITVTMETHGLSVDHRHIMLLADLMTCRGQVLAITRHGLSKMKESILMLASFEKTDEHLFSAAYHGQSNKISGVSDCIILGKPMKIGTGVFKLLHKHQREKHLVKSELLFDHPEFHIPVRNGL